MLKILFSGGLHAKIAAHKNGEILRETLRN